MILEIQTGKDNEILRKKSQPINKIDEEILNLTKDMRETMKKYN
ncbi:MAG: hypothetical protein NT058_00965 [Candidatus Portnoybacteria bacterium]|nr:hypothetical protein [Candidatus Portnoybacteria bacterium]